MTVSDTVIFLTGFLFLAICTFFDCRERSIPLLLLLGGIAAAVFCRCFLAAAEKEGAGWTLSPVLGAGIGGALLAAGRLFPDSFGSGDALIFMACGVLLGFAGNLSLLWLSMVFAMAAALFLMAFRKAGRKTKLPLSPFVLAAWVILPLLQGAG